MLQRDHRRRERHAFLAAQPLPTAETTAEDPGPAKPYQRNSQPGIIHQRSETDPRRYGGRTTERTPQRAAPIAAKETSGRTVRQEYRPLHWVGCFGGCRKEPRCGDGYFTGRSLGSDNNAFRNTIGAAVEIAMRQDSLVTIGIRPNYPETGYGYIMKGKSLGGKTPAYQVERFKRSLLYPWLSN